MKNWLEIGKKSHRHLVEEIKQNEPRDFNNFFRMDADSFQILLDLVKSKIQKQNTMMRDAISAEQRLEVTLRFLATGDSFEDLKFKFGIAAQTIGKIVIETCLAIIEVLRDQIQVRFKCFCVNLSKLLPNLH